MINGKQRPCLEISSNPSVVTYRTSADRLSAATLMPRVEVRFELRGLEHLSSIGVSRISDPYEFNERPEAMASASVQAQALTRCLPTTWTTAPFVAWTGAEVPNTIENCLGTFRLCSYRMGDGFAAIAENQADPSFWNPQPNRNQHRSFESGTTRQRSRISGIQSKGIQSDTAGVVETHM